MRSFLILVLFLILAQGALIDHVDTFIGTGGEGFGVGSDPPGAQRPFGLVRLGPDTTGFDDTFIPWNHFGGYYHGDNQVRCFSHTHMVGSGVLDYGTIGILPIDRVPTDDMIIKNNYRSYFSHEGEEAIPGYYAVTLTTYNVRVELTTTDKVGLHKYHYGKGEKVILFDVSHSLQEKACGDSFIEIDPVLNEVRGYIIIQGSLSGRIGGYASYFVARFSSGISIDSYGIWANGKVNKNIKTAKGCGCGGYVRVKTQFNFDNVEMYVGVSSISIQQARENLVKEVLSQSKNFDMVRTESHIIWEKMLQTVIIEGDNRDDLIKFYTSLYHSYMSPTIFSENGKYLGFDRTVHDLPTNMKNFYSDMSIWDTHRTEFPWLVLTQPEVMTDIINSLLLMYKEGGDLPKWPFANGYTDCMIGTHALVVLADAALKGIKFDFNFALATMKNTSTQARKHDSRTDIDDWNNKGFIPLEATMIGACQTLSYAYDDWAVGNLANMLGFKDDAAFFYNRSKNYKNVWHPEYKFFCPKSLKGEWNCPPTWLDVFDSRYTEGDAWHYRWFVPGDVKGLIELFGSEQFFVEQLDRFMYLSQFDPFNVLPNPYYWAGNEPDILAPWMFNFAGRPDLTQKHVRWNMDNKYTILPDGLPGNDDYGTMSAWYMFAALGFYPLAGSSTYMLGSPLFPKMTIVRNTGNITIVSHNWKKENYYVEKVQLNGKPLTTPFIDHSQITGATLLEFWLTNKPTQQYST